MSRASSPSLSVVIDTYNYGRFIREAIESVLGQTGVQPLEILVADDESTDQTETIMAEFKSRVIYRRKTNGGQASCLNFGIEQTQGDIVCFLDADDLWLPEKLQDVQAAFEQDDDVLMVQHYQKNIDRDGRDLDNANIRPARKDYYTLQDIRTGQGSFSGTSALSFRRSFLREIGPIPASLVYCPDEFLYTVVHFHGRSRSLKKVLSARRLHGANPSSNPTRDAAKLQIFIDVRTFLDSRLQDEFKKRNLDGLTPAEQQRREFEIRKLRCLQYRARHSYPKALRVVMDQGIHHPLSLSGLYRVVLLSLIVLSPSLYEWISRVIVSRLFTLRQRSHG